MNRGIITRYFEGEGKDFGYIKDITGENFFFHISDFCAAVRPESWMKVKFESVPDGRRKSMIKPLTLFLKIGNQAKRICA